MGTRKNRWIKEDRRVQPKEKFKYEFDLYILTAALLETFSLLAIYNLITFRKSITFNDYAWDVLTFVPISLMFEIIFDFFHYWTHRFGHYENKFHKKHHTFSYPTPETTFYQHPVDVIMTNTIPAILALYLITPFSISTYQISILSMYKTFTEVAGHMGKEAFPRSCFPQCPQLVKWLNIELYAKNHDKHHNEYNCNFGKRFALWDKVFGTFKE